MTLSTFSFYRGRRCGTPLRLAIAAAASLALVGLAQAQTVPPNAGDVLRDLPAPKPALPALSDQPASAGEAAPAAAVGQRFTFNRLVVEGLSRLQPFQVQLLADPFVNKPMGEAELAALLQSLRQRLDRAGLTLAMIGLPRLDTAAGVVTVPVVEPKLGRVTVPVNADAPVTEARVRGLLSWFNLREGETLDVAALERVLFALNDMPGVQAKAKLTPSGDEGLYNVSIQLAPRRSWDASVLVDNQGLSTVGRMRVAANGRLNNPLGLGDNLDALAMVTNSAGVKAGRLAYELPVVYTPMRLSLAASDLHYELGGDFKTWGATGRARILEAGLAYPLIRARGRTLLARLGVDDKHFTDQLDEYPDLNGDRRVRTLVASLNWESRDTFGGGGFWGAGFTQRMGKLSYAMTPTSNQPEAGRFGKRELQLNRLQTLSGPVSMYLAISQQSASRNLDPAEKLGLGGARGVRAYAVAEAPSDDATIVNAELRWWLNRHWTVYLLSDWARGHLDHDAAGVEGNTVTRRGSGVGVNATYPDWVTVRATLAWRQSGRSIADPGHDKPRLAVQAVHSF